MISLKMIPTFGDVVSTCSVSNLQLSFVGLVHKNGRGLNLKPREDLVGEFEKQLVEAQVHLCLDLVVQETCAQFC